MKSDIDRHAEQLSALGHPARLAILRWIVQAGGAGASTTEIQQHLDIPWTTLNHHLDRLVATGMLVARRDGKQLLHTTDYAALKKLTDFLWEDCCKRGAPPGSTQRGKSGCC